MAQGIVGDLETEMKSYVASLSTSSTTSLSSDRSNSMTTGHQRSIRCPICLMKFKDPRRLDCQHMFCKDCLQAVLKRQENDKAQLNCLICQEPAALSGPEQVEELDKVLFVHHIKDIYEGNHSDSSIKCSKCDGLHCQYCIQVTCNKCSKYISSMYCRSCNKCLCTKCTRDHTVHELMSIEELHLEMRRQQEEEEEEEEEDDVWEKDSEGSSRDSAGEVNQSYSVNLTDEEGEDTSGGDSDGDSDGENAQSYNITGLEEGDEGEESETEQDIVQEASRPPDSSDDESEQQQSNDETDESTGNSQNDSEERSERESQGASQSNTSIESDEQNRGYDSQEEEEEEEEEEESTVSIEPIPHVTVQVIQHDNNYSLQHQYNEDNELPYNDSSGTSQEEGEEEESIQERPLTIIDSELNDLVNDTIDTDIEQNQLRRLRPSGPSNEKRYSKVILIDKSTEILGPPRYREIRSYKWCLRITVGFIIVFIFTALAIGALSLAAFFLSPRSTKTYVQQNETVLLSKINPFWSLNLEVTSTGPYNSLYYYQTDLYETQCSTLTKVTSTYNVTTSGMQADFVSDLTIDVHTNINKGYAFLLIGSQIDFYVTITSDTTYRGCSFEMNIYSDYDDFLSENGLSAVQTNCVVITKLPDPLQVTHVTFIPTKDSFYYITLSVPPSSIYNITTNVRKISYNSTNISPQHNCSILSNENILSDKCNFTLLTTPIGTDFNDVCILATTVPHPPYVSGAPSIVKMSLAATPNIFRNFVYFLTPVPLIGYLIACLIAWACYKVGVVTWYKCKGRARRNEYRTSIIL